MKKIFILFVIFFASCSNSHTPEQENEIVLSKTIKLTYFKDLMTGICYAEWGNREGNNYSFTCVPCDSITKLKNK